jgi:hypothetical protein
MDSDELASALKQAWLVDKDGDSAQDLARAHRMLLAVCARTGSVRDRDECTALIARLALRCGVIRGSGRGE